MFSSAVSDHPANIRSTYARGALILMMLQYCSSLNTQPRRATHLFVESGKEKESAGKRMIKSARSMTKAVKVLKADYISMFLQQQVNDESKYLVL